MEDAHDVKLKLQKKPQQAFFGIFDGHSGMPLYTYLLEQTVTPNILSHLISYPNSQLITYLILSYLMH
jgi:hypothetical protein